MGYFCSKYTKAKSFGLQVKCWVLACRNGCESPPSPHCQYLRNENCDVVTSISISNSGDQSFQIWSVVLRFLWFFWAYLKMHLMMIASGWLVTQSFYLFTQHNPSCYINYSVGEYFNKPRSLFLKITKIASTEYCYPIIDFPHSHHAVRGQQDLMSTNGEKGIVKKCLFYSKKIGEFWCLCMHHQACTLNSNESQNSLLGLFGVSLLPS